MAKKAGVPPTSRRIFLSGLGSQAGRQLGSFVYKSPALRRKKTPTTAQNYAQQTLAVAARFVSLAQAWEYQTAKDLAGSSGYTWKDQLIAGFFGTALEFTDTDGVLWRGRRIVAQEIQTLLDSISAVPGAILVRTPTGWAALYLGSNEYVLTVNPDTSLPDWLPSQSSSSGGASQSLVDHLNLGANDAYPHGNLRLREQLVRGNLPITGIGLVAAAAVTTAVIYPCIYDLTSFVPIGLLASGPATTGIVKGVNKFPFTSPWTPSNDTLIAHGFQHDTTDFNMVETTVSTERLIVARTGAPPATAPSTTVAANLSSTWFIY